MARELFVEPESVQLPIFDDGQYWITVKRQLTAGESKQLMSSGIKRLSNGTDASASPGYDVDLAAAAFEKVALHLLGWNLDQHGKVIALDTPKGIRDALKALHPDVFAEIERVIDAHVVAMREKKVMPSAPVIAAT